MKNLLDNSIDFEIAEIAAQMTMEAKKIAQADDSDACNGRVGPFYDDLGNADRFLKLIGNDILFVAEARRWLVWVGSHWKWDFTDDVFEKAARFTRQLYSSANSTSREAITHAARSNNRSGLNAMLDLAKRRCLTPIDKFDAGHRDLNFLNGTVNLFTGELRQHDRLDKITRIVNCAYDPQATCPTFDEFIQTVQPDRSTRGFLQRSIGYSLLGNVRERAFWILYGTGNNGKSIFTNLFIDLLGEYASATTTDSIMQGKRSSIPNDIARLKGKRFIVVPETAESERINASLIKALSAGDRVTARFLFAEHFDFYFSGKLWIVTNHMPTVTDHSQGFWDRVKVIPFRQEIAASQVIKSDDLMASLMDEAPGIINWAVQGCKAYFELDGFGTPSAIQEEIERYRLEQDIVAQFLKDCCELGEYFLTYKTQLYDAFVKYSRDLGHLRPVSHTKFTHRLREHRLADGRDRTGRTWHGIRLLG